ncbi:AI-2E family transporter [Paenibacillus dokdonensis]|uniref:AI-2E family transporter n=1 Tax=Paenibacillus dokdonensis TaxID=2567944 RepID=A0ABU6GHP7_9BACL|nr:AI-2E family transporter [Paenibacillus dokdonensis]MEC0238948.1 AI-2E family transporter [Paenibacillus dokdonensis]
MTSMKDFFQHSAVKKGVVLVLLVLVLYLFRSMMNLILITFILTYLVNRLHSSITRRLTNRMGISRKIALILIYALFVAALSIGTYQYAPKLIAELNVLIKQVIYFYSNPLVLTDNKVMNYILDYIHKIDFAAYIKQGYGLLSNTISNVGKFSLNIALAIIMSLFFMLEKEKVTNFTEKFRTSKLSYVYDELAYFGKKFTFSFGKVIEVQFLISVINAGFSTLFLWIMGFPNLFALGLMIFLLGLIPVMGVIVSLVPLCAIAFGIGGIPKVIYILIMVAVLHAFEAYVMNPKFMSDKTHLPIFYTFAVLIISEHFFGVWGLILGVPVFMFLLDLLEVPVSNPPKNPPPAQQQETKPTSG